MGNNRNSVESILKEHAGQDKRSLMAKRMVKEEQLRRDRDMNVEHWDGIQSNKVYRLPVGNRRWKDMGSVGRIFFIIALLALVISIGILIFAGIKSFA